MDPDNPIVKLCVQGMSAETTGDLATAKAWFEQAWDKASNDWEKCVAAHYLARHQETPEATLHWNEECLKHANNVGDATVAGFYPSLYLNIGHSHEILGDQEQALKGYQEAERFLHTLPPGPYADMVRDGVARGLDRLDGVCARRQSSDNEVPWNPDESS